MNLVLEILGDLLGLIFALFCLGLMIVFLAVGRKRPIQDVREIAAFTRFRREVGLQWNRASGCMFHSAAAA